MWALWFIPLLGVIFLSALAVVIVVAIIRRPKSVAAWVALTIAPFGCAALPILAILALSASSALFQKSDAKLFEEIYGFIPEMREDQMLSDDFGIWSNRSIYMKLEATPHDRKRILDVAPNVSTLSKEQFAARGAAEGFIWWDIACEKPDIYDADGYREWQTLTVYDCPERKIMFISAFRP